MSQDSLQTRAVKTLDNCKASKRQGISVHYLCCAGLFQNREGALTPAKTDVEG